MGDNVAASGIQEDDLVIAFRIGAQYVEVEASLVSLGDTGCDVDWNEPIYFQDDCEYEYRGTINWFTFLTECDITADETIESSTFTSQLETSRTEVLPEDDRGIQLTRTSSQILSFSVVFHNQLTVTNPEVFVIQPVEAYAHISATTNYATEPASSQFDVAVSVAWPYQLALTNPQVYDLQNGTELVSITEAAMGLCEDDEECNQNFELTVSQTEADLCSFGGEYMLGFDVVCRADGLVCQPLDDTVEIHFSLVQPDHCVEIVENVDVMGTITAYREEGSQDPWTQFILGTPIYLEVEIESPTEISLSTITDINVHLAGMPASLALYDDQVVTEIGQYLSVEVGDPFIIPGFTSTTTFSFFIAEDQFLLINAEGEIDLDTYAELVIEAAVEIEYTMEGLTRRRLLQFTTQSSAEKASAVASTTVTLSADDTVSSSSSSSSDSTPIIIGIVVAVGVVVLIAAAAVLRRGPSGETKPKTHEKVAYHSTESSEASKEANESTELFPDEISVDNVLPQC
jgi:hypothetical protein